MLRKPGEVDRSITSGTRTIRKVSETSPDEEIRKLQRLATNKKCADCSAKVRGIYLPYLGFRTIQLKRLGPILRLI
jgi:ribosomal protein L34E